MDDLQQNERGASDARSLAESPDLHGADPESARQHAADAGITGSYQDAPPWDGTKHSTALRPDGRSTSLAGDLDSDTKLALRSAAQRAAH